MLGNYQFVHIVDMKGADLRREPTDIPPGYALFSQNSEYDPGNVGTRKGFGVALARAESANSLFNWIKNPDAAVPFGSAAAYFSKTAHAAKLCVNLQSGLTYPLFSDSNAIGASFASGGPRLYAAAFDVNGIGTTQARVTGTDVAAIYIDKAFMGPLTVKPTLSNTGTGNVTAGLHRVGYILTSRNGFTGKISPVTGSGVFDITSTITATGGKQITFSLTATFPTDSDTVYAAMTSVDNLNRFYLVPGASAGVLGGSGGFPATITITIDISDTDLINADNEVTDNVNLLTQDASGNGPFSPFLVLEYGQRIVYFTSLIGTSQYYISDLQNPQQLTGDQHVRYLPGFRVVRSAFVLDSVLYVLGPHWTYAERDNLQLPAAWPVAELVDGQIGALGPLAATANASTGMAWVASTSGLFPFMGGRYAPRPISYYQDPDWRRINLVAGITVQVKDNKDKNQVYVLVPLDGASTPTHLMVFDYSDGMEPETVKYSLWNITAFAPASIEVFQNDTTKRMELWVGNTIAGPILRQMNTTDDGNPYNDNGHAINWQYETALLPGTEAKIGTVYAHPALHIRAKGAGRLNVTTYGLDRTKNYIWPPVTLNAAPGVEYLKRLQYLTGVFMSEAASHRFSTNRANEYAALSAMEHYYNPRMKFR